MSEPRNLFDAEFADDEVADSEDEIRKEYESTQGKSIPEHWAIVISAITYSHIRQTPGCVPLTIFRDVILASYYPNWSPTIWRDVMRGICQCGLARVATKDVHLLFDPGQVPPSKPTRLTPLSRAQLERLYRHEQSGRKDLDPSVLDIEPGQRIPRAPIPEPPDPRLLALAALALEEHTVLIPQARAFALVFAVLGNKEQAEQMLDELDLDDAIYLSGDHVILPLTSLKLGKRYIERHPERFDRKL